MGTDQVAQKYKKKWPACIDRTGWPFFITIGLQTMLKYLRDVFFDFQIKIQFF